METTMSRRVHLLKCLFWPLLIGTVVLPSPVAADERAPSTIVFVCEHGSAKSLVATELFNRLARERGIPVRAISRAVSPQTVDARVPPALARNMSGDGFSVETFQPQPLSPSEAKTASRIVVVNY